MRQNLRYSPSKIPVLLLVLILTGWLGAYAQGLYVGPDAQLYLNNSIPFGTSNTLVEVASTGQFIVEAGNTWGDEQEYVNGSVTAKGTGDTKIPVGNNGVYAPVTATHSGEVTATYFNEAPDTGSLGTGVDDVGEVEYWELTGNAVITLPWNEESGIEQLVNDNGGVFNAITLVGLSGSSWELLSAPGTIALTGDVNSGDATSDDSQPVDLNAYNQFTFGIDSETVLDVDDLFLSTGISLLGNPVRSGEGQIRFVSGEELNQLEVEIYDIQGRLVRSYDRVETHNREGSLPTGNLRSGLYFVKFENEGKQGVKKVLVE